LANLLHYRFCQQRHSKSLARGLGEFAAKSD
jgi:hypothetical protein